MSKLLMELNTELRKMFRDKLNFVILLLVILFGVNVYEYISLNNKITQANIEIKKKVDFRYFNTTKTLEELNNVDIDTLNGELKVKYKR